MYSTEHPANSLGAFVAAASFGFGIELDIRDHCGSVVVAHDPPVGDELEFGSVVSALADAGRRLPIAINVKADGLGKDVAEIVTEHELDDAFVFDMAVPDALNYLRLGLPCFTRLSEVEPEPAFLSQSSGVWVDSFTTDWRDQGEVERYAKLGKRVCLVSPELHGRDHSAAWLTWRDWATTLGDSLMLCTDLPTEAQVFFL